MVRMSRVVVMALAAMALATSGCAFFANNDRPTPWGYPHASMETSPETSREHYERVSSIIAADRRALAEDLDLLFQTERHGRLTRWHSR